MAGGIGFCLRRGSYEQTPTHTRQESSQENEPKQCWKGRQWEGPEPGRQSEPNGPKKNQNGRKMSWRPPNHRIQGIHEDLAWQFDHPDSGKPLVNCQTWAERFGVVPETIRRGIEFMQDS
jgi:hypothetical protein